MGEGRASLTEPRAVSRSVSLPGRGKAANRSVPPVIGERSWATPLYDISRGNPGTALRDTLRQMRKTSLYLSDGDVVRLRRLSERLELSQAEVMRRALTQFEAAESRDRQFALFELAGLSSEDGRSIADIPDEELFEGFGR